METDEVFSYVEKRVINAFKGSNYNTPVLQSFIPRMPPPLQSMNSDFLVPKTVNLGPYHRKANLMTSTKTFYLQRFLVTSKHPLSHHVGKLQKIQNFINHCYTEEIGMTTSEWIYMLLMDGAFLVELIKGRRLRGYGRSQEADPVWSHQSLTEAVFIDILKLENQLPFLLISTLAEEWFEPRVLMGHVVACYKWVLGFDISGSDVPSRLILEYVSMSVFRKSDYHTHASTTAATYTYTMPSATKLRESGVTFKGTVSTHLLDIIFKKRVLYIPKIDMNEGVCVLLANSVAFESYGEDDDDKHCADYLYFMHRLIRTPQDVAYLLQGGVIGETSMEDQNIATFFSRLAGKVVYHRESYLSKQLTDIETYYNSRWATIRRDYITPHWSFMPLVIAGLLFINTMLQGGISLYNFVKNLMRGK